MTIVTHKTRMAKYFVLMTGSTSALKNFKYM